MVYRINLQPSLVQDRLNLHAGPYWLGMVNAHGWLVRLMAELCYPEHSQEASCLLFETILWMSYTFNRNTASSLYGDKCCVGRNYSVQTENKIFCGYSMLKIEFHFQWLLTCVVVSFSTACGINSIFYIKFEAWLRLTNIW